MAPNTRLPASIHTTAETHATGPAGPYGRAPALSPRPHRTEEKSAMSKSIDVATATIHLQGIGRVPAVAARKLKVGDQLTYNYGGVYQITKIEDASPKFFRIFEVSAETGEEHSSRVKKDRLAARVPEADRRRLGHDAPTTLYRAQVYAPVGRTWGPGSSSATAPPSRPPPRAAPGSTSSPTSPPCSWTATDWAAPSRPAPPA